MPARNFEDDASARCTDLSLQSSLSRKATETTQDCNDAPQLIPFFAAVLWLTLAFLLFPKAAVCQPLTSMNVGSVQIDGPQPPRPPAVVSRDNEGRATVRATRLLESLTLDGRLVEDVYRTILPITAFIQQEPQEGQPATDKTEVWLFYDEQNIYVAFRCWSSEPQRMVANEMRRDNGNIYQNDHVAIAFDTFYDRRNGVFFQTNPVGGLRDGAIINESDVNYDWDTVWDAKSLTFDGGWTSEIAIPFKSLRYSRNREQIWGLTIQRVDRGKNEISYIQRMPASYGGGALFQVSAAATLVGIEVPKSQLNLEVKPSFIGDVTTDRMADPAMLGVAGGDFGFDVKYGVTKNLTFDFTYNTDFAQVEIDEQQVNLTRFSLFYPEKRDFFLEGRGIFAFGAGPGSGRRRGGGDVPTIFFSRRIGLSGGRTVPILGGGRLTGKVGKFSIGAVNIQTGDEPTVGALSTNFTALRVKRDILRRSSIGMIATSRSVSTVGEGSNEAYGVDAVFSFYDNVNFNGYYARTQTPGLEGDDVSYQGAFSYNGDRYGFKLDHLLVGDNFNPEVGFLRRDDFRRTFASARVSPRPASIRAVRKFTLEASLDYIENGAGQVETRLAQARFDMEFENSDRFGFDAQENYELLVRPFNITSNVTIPVGGYAFRDVFLSYAMGPQRRLAGTFSIKRGEFFGGNITTMGYRRGRIEVTPQLSIEPSISINQVELPEGAFTAKLISSRASYAFTPRMYVSGFIQYNSSVSSLGSKIRFRWEYEPGSDVFVVYADGWDATQIASPLLVNRTFIVKYTRLFRF